jgi:hypothetical protein
MKVLSHFESLGNIELLSQSTLSVFASKNTPQEIYPSAEDLFLSLCRLPLSLSSGWQAPLEKKLLNLTYPEMTANILYYSAKDLSKTGQDRKLKALNMFGKLLLISAESRSDRPTRNDVDKRDTLLFQQTEKVLFLYIESGGRLERYYNQFIEKNFPVYILDHELNRSFISPASIAVHPDTIDTILAG